MPTMRIETHRGAFTIDTDQIVGVEKVILQSPTGPVEGSNILISIGVIPQPRTETMRMLADAIEQAGARVQPVTRVILPQN